MERYLKQLIIILILSISYILGHCQVPCGIYDDSLIILEIEQHIQTIEKAISKIESLSIKKNQNPNDMNQLIRWINTKEHHAQLIQNSISEYFLSQRIKPENPDNDNYNKYVNLTIICQKIIFTSMKTKQMVDIKYVDELKMLIELLIQKYFDDHGLNHLKLLRNK